MSLLRGAYLKDGQGLMKEPLLWCAGGDVSRAPFCCAEEGGMDTVTAVAGIMVANRLEAQRPHAVPVGVIIHTGMLIGRLT
jgi:hypothetical protein